MPLSAKENGYAVALVGASGNVGRQILKTLHARRFPLARLDALASPASVGKKVSFGEGDLKLGALENYDFSLCDMAFFAAGGKIARLHAPKAAKSALVIDLSSHFRMEEEVPLIIPEVNGDLLKTPFKKGVIANPNCSISQLVVALKPLHDQARLKRVHVATYQSVSGAGRAAVEELQSQAGAGGRGRARARARKTKSAFTKPMAFNVLPHIDVFCEDGETKEEWKMAAEFSKIMGEEIPLSALCVRVPVMVGHAEAVWAEFENPLSVEEARDALSAFPGCKVIDKREDGGLCDSS